MLPEIAPQQPSPTLSPDRIQGILEGTDGAEIQKEALWHVIQTMINMAFDSASIVTDGTVKSKGNLIFA
jgi:hypothetical protein